jgi:hypothetical protein|tara:strand:+ start:4015 stop:4725 length:711 start_codon:yes stop_codon:yes gene_type:complete
MSKITKDDWIALEFSLDRKSSDRYLSPLECASLLAIAKDQYSTQTILEKIKISGDMFGKILSLEKIKPKKIRDSIVWGHSNYNLGLISMSVSKYIAKLEDEQNQLELYGLVCKHRLTKTEIKDIIPEFNRGISLIDGVKNVVSLRPKIVKKNQIIGKIINKELSQILNNKSPKERNILFNEYLSRIVSKDDINTCVLNENNFFIDCTNGAAEIILSISTELELYISEQLLKIVFND